MLVTELVLILDAQTGLGSAGDHRATTVALLMACHPGIPDCRDIGLVLIQPFFAVIGLSTTVGGCSVWDCPCWFMLAIHAALVVLLVRRQQRWALVDSLVASQAAVGGPSTALALASSLGRSSLVLPSVAAGLLGMMLGTYLGLAVEALYQWPAS